MPAFSGPSGAGWAINSCEYFEIPTFKRWREILREVAVNRARSKSTPSMGKGFGDWGLGAVPSQEWGGVGRSRGAVMITMILSWQSG